jgi:hypothetical protein
LALTVGSASRYANYVSGSGSTTLVFRYTPQSGDTDSDGIAFASTSVDLNGGTIRDQVSWDLAPGFSAPVVTGILIDTTAPVITGLTNDAVPTASKTWTWGCSETCTYRYVINTSVATTPSGSFTSTNSATISTGSGTRYIHVQGRDSAGNLSAVVHVSAVINGAAAPDPSAWSWALSSPAAASVSTDSTPQFSASGAAADNGATVQLYDDSSCTHAVGSVRTVSGGAVSFSDVSYLTDGSQDGTHAFYAVATNFGNSSVCTDIALNYFLDSLDPGAPGSPLNGTTWTTNTTTSPTFTWTSPTDPGGAGASGVAAVEVGLSTSSGGGNDAAGWTAKSAVSVSHSFTGLSLTQCTAYYPSLRAVDGAGRTSSVVVAAAFRPDSTAPAAPVISVGTNQTLSQTPTITITTAGSDNCSFQGYDFMLSRDSDHDGVLDAGEQGNVVGWTNIGTVTTYQRTSLTLAAGAGYFVSLRSKDAAGNVSSTVSSSVWYGQYCEGATNGVAYYSYVTPATAQLSDVFVKATVPGWGTYDYSNVGSVTNITAATTTMARPQGDTYGLMYSAQLEVKTAGTYTFYSSSDDGSDVYVGATRVVANDGLHGLTEVSGTIALTPGCYDLQVRFFENNGGDEVTLSWQGPSITKAAVPSTFLYPRYVPMPEIDWKFDAGSGTVATDSSMNALSGTLTNAPAWATNPVCAYASARAVNFDGVNDFVVSGTLTGVDVLQSNLSLSFWFKTTSTSTSMVYADLSSGATPGLVIRAGTTAGTIGFDSSGGVGTAAFTATTYNDGGWHHAVAIRRGTNLKLFVDGVQRITTTVTSTATTFNKVTVGANGTPANYFSGSIDQFKVWNDALDNSVSSNAVSELFSYPCR